MCLILDEQTKRVCSIHGWKNLTPSEYGILSCLYTHPGTAFTPEQLYQYLWHEDPYECDNLMCVHIHNIRKKIELDPARPVYLLAKRGKGYLISDSALH